MKRKGKNEIQEQRKNPIVSAGFGLLLIIYSIGMFFYRIYRLPIRKKICENIGHEWGYQKSLLGRFEPANKFKCVRCGFETNDLKKHAVFGWQLLMKEKQEGE